MSLEREDPINAFGKYTFCGDIFLYNARVCDDATRVIWAATINWVVTLIWNLIKCTHATKTRKLDGLNAIRMSSLIWTYWSMDQTRPSPTSWKCTHFIGMTWQTPRQTNTTEIEKKEPHTHTQTKFNDNTNNHNNNVNAFKWLSGRPRQGDADEMQRFRQLN